MVWLAGLSELLGGGLPVRNALLYTYIAEGKNGALYALCAPSLPPGFSLLFLVYFED